MLPVVEIPPLVAESAKCFDGVFSLHQSKHFERYLTGLMTDSNITVAHMAENLVEGISQRGLNRFLTEYEGDAEELNPRRIKLLQEDPKMRQHNKGVELIDDSLIEKTDKLIPGAGRLYDHNSKSFVHAQNIATSHYADWRKHYSKEAQEHGFKTKIMPARELVDEAEKIRIPAETYILDSWFLCRKLADHIESYNKNWVMQLRHTPQTRVMWLKLCFRHVPYLQGMPHDR